MKEGVLEKSFKRSEQFMTSDLGDAIVLSDIGSDRFFGTNKVGAHIWELLQEPITASTLCDQLMLRFKVERDQCEQQVSLFINELIEINAIVEV